MEGNKHFRVQVQKRPPSVGVVCSRVGSHLAVWFHLRHKCLVLEVRVRS